MLDVRRRPTANVRLAQRRVYVIQTQQRRVERGKRIFDVEHQSPVPARQWQLHVRGEQLCWVGLAVKLARRSR